MRIVFVIGMGLLSEGTPLAWPETKKYANHVRKHGVQQFLNHYQSFKERSVDCLKWGDEVGKINVLRYILVVLS